MKNYEWPKLVYMNTRSKKQKEYYYLDYQKKNIQKIGKKMKQNTYMYILRRFIKCIFFLFMIISDLVCDIKIIFYLKNIFYYFILFDMLFLN